MGSVAKLKYESRELDFDISRESRINKRQRRNTFPTYNDSEAQLHRENRDAKKRKMSSDTGSISSADTAQLPVSHNALKGLQLSLASGKFSDLIITHGDRIWNAHKVVVCSQSPSLEAMIEEDEKGKNVIRLDEYDYETVCLLIDYLYGSNYVTQDIAPDFSLPVHIKVFALSITLSIPGLSELSTLKFRHNLNNYINDPLIFFSAVRSIYFSTTAKNPALRLAVLEAGISEMRNLLKGPHKEEFLRLTREVPEFQVEIYLLMLENPYRPMEVVAPELCVECGPRGEGDGYEVMTECKECGEKRTLSFY